MQPVHFSPSVLFCSLFLKHLGFFSLEYVNKTQKVILSLMHYGKILYPDPLRCPISAIQNLGQILHRDLWLSFTRDWVCSIHKLVSLVNCFLFFLISLNSRPLLFTVDVVSSFPKLQFFLAARPTDFCKTLKFYPDISR